MTMTKLRFIDSSRNERKRNESTVGTTVTEVMTLELKELLVDVEAFLTLPSETKAKLMR